MSQIERINGRIKVIGHFGDQDLHYLLSNVHHAIAHAGFLDIILDFSECNHAAAPAMLATCAQMMNRCGGGCDISLELPKDIKLRRLFINTNWAHLVDPRRYDPSHFRGYTQIPATQYKNAEEQQLAVNNIVNAILGAVRDLSRADFAAFEWSVNEITDNVLTHSESSIGGLIRIHFPARQKSRAVHCR